MKQRRKEMKGFVFACAVFCLWGSWYPEYSLTPDMVGIVEEGQEDARTLTTEEYRDFLENPKGRITLRFGFAKWLKERGFWPGTEKNKIGSINDRSINLGSNDI